MEENRNDQEELSKLRQDLLEAKQAIAALQKNADDNKIELEANKEIAQKLKTENATLKDEIASVKKTNFILSQQGHAEPQMSAEEAIAAMFGLKKGD